MALVDADYKFLFVDVGCNGRISDGGVFRNSRFSSALKIDQLGIPPPEPIPQSENQTLMPYVLVADDAFPLSQNIMKPFS